MIEALYHIQGLYPVQQMSGCGFSIQLFPAMKREVAAYGMTQDHADTWIKNLGPRLLKVHGFDADLFRLDLRVQWGEWGPHHINVPGNACGLDIEDGLGRPPDGKVLLPHNVDSIHQAHLLLCVFTGLVEALVLQQVGRELEARIAEAQRTQR